jgi:hypothetical protein
VQACAGSGRNPRQAKRSLWLQLAVVSALVDLLCHPSVQSMPVHTPADIARALQAAYQAKLQQRTARRPYGASWARSARDSGGLLASRGTSRCSVVCTPPCRHGRAVALKLREQPIIGDPCVRISP